MARHREQLNNDDCGLTCIEMIYPITLCRTIHKSTWTIDLALILYQQGAQISVYSINFKADHQFTPFYILDHDIDKPRVEANFDLATRIGLTTIKRKTFLHEVFDQFDYVIVLIDWRKLNCQECGFRLKILFPFFIGHYILVNGSQNGDYLYLDPGKSHSQCRISKEALEKARDSSGTDFDMIGIRT